MVEYKFLTAEQRQHFLEHGWLLIPNSIPKEHVDKWMADLWCVSISFPLLSTLLTRQSRRTRLGYNPTDPSTWNEEVIWMPRHRDMLTKEFSPDAWAAMCELVGGEERIEPVLNTYSGDQFIVNFGTEELKNVSVHFE